MAWIELHQGLSQHHKIRRLKRLLGIGVAQAAGHMALLWTWALDATPAGDLSAFEAVDVAEQAEWEGDPDTFIEALVSAGLVDREDGRLVIHDWMDYAGRLVEKRRADTERKRMSRGRPTDIHATAHVTVPNRTVPNQEIMSTDVDVPMPDVPFEAGPYPLTPAEDDLDLEAVFPEAEAEGVTQEVSRGLAPAPRPKKTRRAAAYSPAFEAFWGAYPGGGAKIKAWDQWLAADLEADGDKMGAVLAAVDAQVADRKRTPAGGFYPEWPDAERWIKNQRWTDKLRNSDGPGVVPIATAASSPREAFLTWVRGLTSTIGRNDDKVRCLVERAAVVDGVTVDLDAAHRVLEEQGLDEAWVWVHRATQAGKAQRREVANG